jgi:putative selenate reductase FAD-binding subunit
LHKLDTWQEKIMIIDYLRPTSLQDAINLISRKDAISIPIGGGSTIKHRATLQDFNVVDLQELKLDAINLTGDWMEFGSMVRLQTIGDHPEVDEVLKKAIKLEGTANTRNQATLGGRVVAFDGRSALITTLLAADAVTIWDEGHQEASLGEWLALPVEKPGKLLLAIKISRKVRLVLKVINRTELDLPILCVAAARWPSGRIRLAVGGYGESPRMAFDGQGSDGAELAVENACRKSDDFRASEEYRRAISIVLTRRCMKALQESS